MRLTGRRFSNTAKRLTPRLSNLLLASSKVRSGVELFEIYLGILQGKGAASAWSREGEAAAINEVITAPRPVIFDVGARIGEWAELTDRSLGRPATFVLVEPSSVHWPTLEALDVPGDLHLIRAAAGKAEGTAVLRASFPGAGNASLYERHDTYWDQPFKPIEETQVTTIPKVAESLGVTRIDFLKIDVEGSEFDVLQGTCPLFESGSVQALSFEFGSANINARVFFRDFWDFLRHYGFRLRRITPGGRALPLDRYDESLERFRGATNYIGVRNF